MAKSAPRPIPAWFICGVGVLAACLGAYVTSAHAQPTSPVAPEWSQYLFGQGGITGASNIMSGIENGLISALQATGSGLTSAAKAIFGALALVGFAWTFGQLAMRRTDLGEIFAELTRYIVITGLFFFFVNNMGTIANAIIQTVNNLAGGNGTGGGNSPDVVFGKGLTYFNTNIIQQGIQNGIYNTYQQCVAQHSAGIFGQITVAIQCDVPALGIAALMLLLGALVVVVYLMIAIDILILRISFWAVTYIGMILLGFGAQGSVRDIAIKYLRTVGSHGMSLLAIQLIVGAGLQVFSANQYTQGGSTYTLNIIGQFFEIVILYLLAHKVPYMIGAMVGGDSGGHSAGVGARAVGYAAEAGVAAGLAAATGGAVLAGAGGAGAAGIAGGAEGPLGAAASIGGPAAGAGSGAAGGAFMEAGTGAEAASGGGASSGLGTPLGEALGNDGDGEDGGDTGAGGAGPGTPGGPTEEGGAEEAGPADDSGPEGGGGVGGAGPGSPNVPGGAGGAARPAGGGATAGRLLAAAAAGGALAGVGRTLATSSRAAGHVAALGTGQHPGFGAPGRSAGGPGAPRGTSGAAAGSPDGSGAPDGQGPGTGPGPAGGGQSSSAGGTPAGGGAPSASDTSVAGSAAAEDAGVAISSAAADVAAASGGYGAPAALESATFQAATQQGLSPSISNSVAQAASSALSAGASPAVAAASAAFVGGATVAQARSIGTAVNSASGGGGGAPSPAPIRTGGGFSAASTPPAPNRNSRDTGDPRQLGRRCGVDANGRPATDRLDRGRQHVRIDHQRIAEPCDADRSGGRRSFTGGVLQRHPDRGDPI